MDFSPADSISIQKGMPFHGQSSARARENPNSPWNTRLEMVQTTVVQSVAPSSPNLKRFAYAVSPDHCPSLRLSRLTWSDAQTLKRSGYATSHAAAKAGTMARDQPPQAERRLRFPDGSRRRGSNKASVIASRPAR